MAKEHEHKYDLYRTGAENSVERCVACFETKGGKDATPEVTQTRDENNAIVDLKK